MTPNLRNRQRAVSDGKKEGYAAPMQLFGQRECRFVVGEADVDLGDQFDDFATGTGSQSSFVAMRLD